MSIPHRQQAFPLLIRGLAIPTSVTLAPLASDSKSSLLLTPTSDNKTHNHGPSIFGPPFGSAGLPCQKSVVIFSR